MIRPSSTLLALCVVLPLLSGCGTSGTSTTAPKQALPPTAAVSPFSIPAGWLDFSGDSTRNALLWLVKKDYGAEIVVENIFDAPKATAGSEEASQIEAIARAIFLIDKGRSTSVIQEPEKSESGVTSAGSISCRILRGTGCAWLSARPPGTDWCVVPRAFVKREICGMRQESRMLCLQDRRSSHFSVSTTMSEHSPGVLVMNCAQRSKCNRAG